MQAGSRAPHRAPRLAVPETREAFSPWVLTLCVLVPTLIVYLGTTGFPYVFDDIPQIVNNPFIASWGSLPEFFSARIWNLGWSAGGGSATFYRPVFFVWLLINRSFFGLHPWGWHLAVVLLHLGATFLVYRLALRLTADEATAVLAGLLFGIHPVHIEAVAWVSGATEPLLTVLFIGSFLCFLNSRVGQGVRWLALSLGFGALALLSKETALVLPGVILAYVWLFEPMSLPVAAPGKRALSAIRAAMPFLLLAAVYLGLRLLIFGGLPPALTRLPFSTLVLTWPSVLVFDLVHLAWPANLSLFYDTRYVSSLSVREFWVPLAVLAFAGAAICVLARKSNAKAVAFASAWMLLTIVPALNFRAFRWREIAHDRYLYLPSVGFVILVAIAIRRLPTTPRLLGKPALQLVAVLLIVGLMATSTVGQSLQFGSALVLYSHAASVAPDNVAAIYLLAGEITARGRIDDGLALYERAARLAPRWPQAWLRLGELHYVAGQYHAAESDLARATELDATNPAALYLLGMDRMRLGRPLEAEVALRKAIELQPSGAGFHLALARLLRARGDNQAAAAELQKELQYHPENAEAERELGELAK